MRNGDVDIGVNWVSWLREQAARHYIWDEKAQYFRVNAPRGKTERTLRDAWRELPAQRERFPNLHHNFFINVLPKLTLSARSHISKFFTARGLRDFEFLNHGGRAITFRALHSPTGQMRVARMEAPHSHRYPRPDHPVILQPFASNQGYFHFYGDIKLEIMPEIISLNAVRKAYDPGVLPLLQKAFYEATWSLGWGTNMMYGPDMYDCDSEMTNVALCPDGLLRSFDPEVVTGELARVAPAI